MLYYLFILITIQFLQFHSLEASCNCPACPAPICPSVKVCPPTVICPTKICPPAPACPVIVPKPCPICIKPIIKTVPIPIIKPVIKVIEKPVLINKCCKSCDEPCSVRLKRDLSSATIVPINSLCNNKILEEIIATTMTSNLIESQQMITKKLKKFFGNYNIFCTDGDFSYAVHTDDFCQVTKFGVTCYAFKNL